MGSKDEWVGSNGGQMNKPARIDIDSSDDFYVTNNVTYLRAAGFSFRLE